MEREALPDASSTNKAVRYIQAQAGLGRFKNHSTALLVMYYLVTYMWVRPSPDGSQGQGEVVRSRSGINDIVAGTALSRRAVQTALIWLADNEWLDVQRSADDTGRELRQHIYLKLDVPGHRLRERRRVAPRAMPGVASRATPRVASRATPIRVSS